MSPKPRKFLRVPIAAAVAAAVALAFTACSPSAASSDAPKTLAMAAIANIESFAPGNFNTGPTTVYVQPVYDSILRNDDDGEPQANIATEWSYDDSLTVLSLTLRDDVSFTDGTKLDAEAVKANLETAKKGTGESAGQLRFVDHVDVVDATHVTVTLSAIDPTFLQSIGGPAGMLASPKALGTKELETVPVGSGPYELDAKKTQQGVKYVFSRNPDYWNKADYKFDEVSVTVFNDATAIMNAVRSGQLNFAAVSAKDEASLTSAGVDVVSLPAYNASGLFLFDREGTLVPALGDVRVRQALNYAMNRPAILDQAFGGKGTATTQMFSTESAAYDKKLDDAYPYDVAKAKKLLADAGYADGFTLPMPDVSPVYPEQQAAVTEALQAIGVTPDYQPTNGETFISDLISGKYPAAIFGLNTQAPWTFAQLALTPDALWNTFHVSDPTIVSLVDKAQTQTGADQDATFRELNKYVVDQAWFAPYAQYDNVFALKDVTITPQKFATYPPLWNFTPAA